MKFKIGDKVRIKDDPYIRSFNVESWAKAKDVNKYYLYDEWYEENELEFYHQPHLATDPLAAKVEERNNKNTSDDKVNSPNHYTRGDIEVIDIIKQLTEGYEPFEAYLVGNTIKYLARANFKENKQQDLEKAQWHINKLLEEEEWK